MTDDHGFELTSIRVSALLTAAFALATLLNRGLAMLSIRNSCLLFASCAIFSSTLAFTFAQVVQWPVAGQGATNLRSQPAETYLGAANAASLIPKWIFTTSGDVSATPTVGTTAVFVPDWDGNLFAIDLATGAQLWSHQISEYDGYAGAVTRVSPALYNSSIYYR
ncbi:MAG: PQQ-binding-like beta-propeller repeat protein [Candidatus Sulfotelmatobacter sp.]